MRLQAAPGGTKCRDYRGSALLRNPGARVSIDADHINPDNISQQDGPSGGRFAYRFRDGSEAEMVYSRPRPGVVGIVHTGTPRQHRGQGIAAALVARAVSDFRAGGLRVAPLCSFAREEFARHPEWSDILVEA